MLTAGYRYSFCAPSPNTSPSPLLPFFRTIPGPPPSPPVSISWLDRSAFLRLSPDGLTCFTDKGFRSGRGTLAVREGLWYYEVVIENGSGSRGASKGSGDTGNPHVRIGWGRREAVLDAPVGACGYSYGIRDVNGEKLHIARPKPYANRPFSTGDVVGCLISLPKRPDPEGPEDAAYVKRWRVPLRYKGQQYFEQDEYPIQKEMEALVNREGKPPATEVPEVKKTVKKKKGEPEPAAPINRELKTLEGSYIEFFINGVSCGKAFENIYDFLPLPPLPGQIPPPKKRNTGDRERAMCHDDGTLGYFPMVSCFGRGKARVNFGPQWLAPVELPPGTRAVCDRWEEFRADEEKWDERDEVELTEKINKDLEAARLAEEAAKARGEAEPQPKRPSKKKKLGTGASNTPINGTPVPEAHPMPHFEGTPGPASTPAGPDRSSPAPMDVKDEYRMDVDDEQKPHLSHSPAPTEIKQEPALDEPISAYHMPSHPLEPSAPSFVPSDIPARLPTPPQGSGQAETKDDPMS